MSGIDSSTLPWYISRSTGIVALLLMTAVMLIGILVSRNGKLPGLPRFAAAGLHRNLSLVALAFVALHVLTAIADSFVSIPLTAVIIPLTSGYERLALSLGAVSLDLTLAIIVTSLIRERISPKAWRVVHLLAYLSWPVAWLHSITASKDLRSGWLFTLAIAALLAVVAATGWRLAGAARDIPRAERVGRLMAAIHRPSGRRPSDHRQPVGGHGQAGPR